MNAHHKKIQINFTEIKLEELRTISVACFQGLPGFLLFSLHSVHGTGKKVRNGEHLGTLIT